MATALTHVPTAQELLFDAHVGKTMQYVIPRSPATVIVKLHKLLSRENKYYYEVRVSQDKEGCLFACQVNPNRMVLSEDGQLLEHAE